MAQFKSRKLDRNQKTYEEQTRLFALFDKIEKDMGIERSSYQQKRIERMVESDMNANATNSERRVCRGEIYYVVPEGEVASSDRNAPFVGGRPAVIVSNDMNNEMQGLVEVAYCTTHPRNNLPTNVVIMSTGTKSTVICDQIYTVSKKRIGKYVGECTANEVKKINDALALGLALNYSDKNVGVNILESWKDELSRSYTTTQLNQVPEEDDALIQEKVKETVVQPDASKNESESNFVLSLLKFHFGDAADIVMSSEEEFTKWLESVVFNTKKVDELSKELYEKQKELEMAKVAPQPAATTSTFDVTTSPEYIKVCAERDVYKDLYASAMAK